MYHVPTLPSYNRRADYLPQVRNDNLFKATCTTIYDRFADLTGKLLDDKVSPVIWVNVCLRIAHLHSYGPLTSPMNEAEPDPCARW
jgi:hypothetical protein